jgi:hypothetical protein
MEDLPRVPAVRRDGSEPFCDDGRNAGFEVLDFWRWSASDLVSNATRGRLAEYLVAKAVGISTAGVRDEWAAYDLRTESGIRIEVKSAAYLQSWYQARPSKISFSVRKARGWDPDTNEVAAEPTRSADIYVFALLHHSVKSSLDPLDLTQWTFFVVPTSELNTRTRSQHSITLPSLTRIAESVGFGQLGAAVRRASEGARTSLPANDAGVSSVAT